jgi:hypothetical protein
MQNLISQEESEKAVIKTESLVFFTISQPFYNAMADKEITPSNSSVYINGDVVGSALVIGDGNKVSIQFQQASIPHHENVDIQMELKALQAILFSLSDPVTIGVAQKLGEEAKKNEPDKGVVVATLETGLTYAKTLTGFADALHKLRPHVEATVGWLGKQGCRLLPLVGLVL